MTARFGFATLLAVGSLVATQAFASGFEKSIPWGGQTSGVAGIATPYIEGSQALYFNPAGLVSDKVGQDVSFNLSPTFPSFKGPILRPASQETAKSETLFPFGLMYGNTLSDKLGFGVGVYVSGGTQADFQNLSNAAVGVTGTSELKTDLTIMEFAAGVGYKVNDKLKVGAAWRVTQVTGALDNIKFIAGAPSHVVDTDLSGLKDTNYLGFKLGAQYKLSDKTSFGLSYRSETNFKTKGSYTQTMDGSALGSGSATVATTFPQAVTLGARYVLNDSWNMMWEYAWTQYSKVTNLDVGLAGSGTPIQLHWKDQSNIRLAGEYKGLSMPIRFGYIWTSQVTNSDYAFASIVPPAPANTLTLGTGYNFGSFKTDGGLEYTWLSGSGTGVTAKYAVTEYALHLGVDYTF